MKEYKGYKIPCKEDLKTKGIVIPFGNTLMVKISDDILFDTGIRPYEVYDMEDDVFENIIYSRASAFIDSFINGKN